MQYDPLRPGSDAWAHPDGMVTAEGDEEKQRYDTEGESNDWEGEGPQGSSDPEGINVPRQRYIAVPKEALLDAVLSQFASDDDDAADFKRCARCNSLATFILCYLPLRQQSTSNYIIPSLP